MVKEDRLETGRVARLDETPSGPPTEHDLKRIHEEGLACARLARERGQPVAELDGSLVDDAEVADVELEEHPAYS